MDAIEEVAPIKNNAKETFVNATADNGDNAVGGNLSYQGVTQDVRIVGENEQSIVYRVIRADENPLEGLVAKKPQRGMTVEGHVISGSRNKGSQFISTSRY